MAFLTNSLPNYVEQHKSELIYKSVFGGRSISRFAKQTGVKGTSAINLLSTTPIFQDGNGCGFNASGDATLSQRNIVTGLIKVNMSFCPDALIGKYAENEVAIAAGKEVLPFEEQIAGSITDGINEGMERAVWQGDTASDDATLKHFDGLLKILNSAEGVVKKAVVGTTAYEQIKEVYMAIPEAILLKNDVKINVSPAVYREFIMNLVEANLYHYSGPQNSFPEEIVLPGTNVAVACVAGLTGTKNIVAASDSNLYYGCDMEGDKEEFKFWFSDDDDIFKLKVRWNAGTQVAFPDQVVLATYTA